LDDTRKHCCRASPLAHGARNLPFGCFLLESLELCERGVPVAGVDRVSCRNVHWKKKWVARCTAPGLKGDRAARRPYGIVVA